MQPNYGYPGGYNNAGYDQGHGVPPPAAYGAPQPQGYAGPQAKGYGAHQPPPPPIAPPAYAYAVNQPNAVTPGGDVEGGNTPFAASTFNDKVIRHRFVRKVYLILTAQLLFTVAFVAFFVLHTPTKLWVQENYWLYYISYGLFLATYIALVCCKGVRQKTPGNYICLIIFTCVFTYMAATISSYYDISAVLIAMGITCAVCIAVTIFSIQTKFDFTKCSGLLFVLLIVLLLFGLSVIIVYSIPSIDNKTKYVLQCVYGTLGALVFTLFLAYDTQLIVGGRKYEYSEEDYISASLQLYLDVVYIFLFLLMAMGGGSKS